MDEVQQIVKHILDNPQLFKDYIDVSTYKKNKKLVDDTLQEMVSSKYWKGLSSFQKSALITTALKESTLGVKEGTKPNQGPLQHTATFIQSAFEKQADKQLKDELGKDYDKLAGGSKEEKNKLQNLYQKKLEDLAASYTTTKARNNPNQYIPLAFGQPAGLLKIDPLYNIGSGAYQSGPVEDYEEAIEPGYTLYNLGVGAAKEKRETDPRKAAALAMAKIGDASYEDRKAKLPRSLKAMKKQISSFKDVFIPEDTMMSDFQTPTGPTILPKPNPLTNPEQYNQVGTTSEGTPVYQKKGTEKGFVREAVDFYKDLLGVK